LQLVAQNAEVFGDDEEAATDYQLEYMRCLREVNVDNNTMGWWVDEGWEVRGQ
jgi:hypothetical protein